MAITVLPLMAKDITSITIQDATGTPLTKTVIPVDGEVEIIHGEYEEWVEEDQNGVPISGTAPRQAGVRNRAGLRLAVTVFDAGDNATDANILDILTDDGVVDSAPWVSTTTGPETGTTMRTLNWIIVLADRTDSGGTVKGATYTLPNARLVGNPSVRITRQRGARLDLELRSTTAVRWTVARTA